MDKYNKLKEIIKKIVREEILGEDQTAFVTTAKGRKAISYKDTEELYSIKQNSDVKGIETAGGQKLKEFAAPNTVIYTLKNDADDRLKEYLSRIKKESVKRIVTKMVDILKTEKNASIGELFTQLKQELANDADALAALKATVNVKGWLWGGVNSDEFNRRYTTQINPATGERWESGDLNAISWTPFVRFKDKRLTNFEKAQQQAVNDPEAFAAKQASFKQTNTLAEKVLNYKFLRADYFTKGSQQRADVKIDKTLKGKQGEIITAEKMTNMLTDDLAVALLYQWKEGYLEVGLDKPLQNYANENGLLDGKKVEGLTDKYSELVLKLINNGDIKTLNKKEFNVKKKEKTTMSKDDIEAYYKSIGMDVPDNEKIDLTNNDLNNEEDEEEL